MPFVEVGTFYRSRQRILQPRSRIRGNAWIELQNGKKLVEILNRIRCKDTM